MAILNETIHWAQFAANPALQKAFRGTPTKTLIPAGSVLARFITTESKKKGARGNEIYLSPWWSEWSTTVGEVHKWSSMGATAREVIRGRFAVTSEFSQELDSLVLIVMKKPVYAWKGVARHQDDDNRKVTYLGGATQLFLPNLASDAQGLSSAVADLRSFTSVDELV
jgi:hypothetical protein